MVLQRNTLVLRFFSVANTSPSTSHFPHDRTLSTNKHPHTHIHFIQSSSMIRKIASRRLAASSALTHRATALPKSSPAAAKRFGHGHHDPEYPPESLFNKTSIFLVAFTTFTTALLLNDKFNSKTGKSIIGDWLVPSTKVEETEKNWEQGVAELEKFRKDKLLRDQSQKSHSTPFLLTLSMLKTFPY